MENDAVATKQLEEVIERIEQLPINDQDAIAALLQRELDIRQFDRRREIGLAAIDRLAKLTADLPPVDALLIARESREALDERFTG
jgi:hypothetical protein